MPALPTPPGSDSPGLFARKFGADQEFVHGKRLQSRKSRPPQRAPANNLLDTQKIICWQAKNARKNQPSLFNRQERGARGDPAAPGSYGRIVRVPLERARRFFTPLAPAVNRGRNNTPATPIGSGTPAAVRKTTAHLPLSGLRCLVYDVWSTMFGLRGSFVPDPCMAVTSRFLHQPAAENSGERNGTASAIDRPVGLAGYFTGSGHGR